MFAAEAAFAMMLAAADDPRVPDRDPSSEIVPRRPGPSEPLQYVPPLPDSSQVPPPMATLPREQLPVADRWRIMRSLGVNAPWYDPYNPNVLKGDLPIAGEAWFRERLPRAAEALGPDWFVNLGIVSDTLLEARRLPTPVGPQATADAGSLDVYGRESQTVATETLIVSMALIKGDTTFKPPDYEFRLVPAFNVNRSEVEELRALRIDPR